ncbi:MAG TPA: carboxypeptidase regulatory-like domain-containing protein [Candidatus Aquilonibacter sp.]|nr:carboxypeptidase regulatory-like domain-containing protein [Candidatus Aquilonibacter sp.]
MSRFVFALLAVAFLGASHLQAQVETGTITGTAKDASGAALVGASVEAKNEATGIAQSTVSDAQGRYTIALLPIGTYDVDASRSGFQTVNHTGVVLTVGATVVVDFSLPVGPVSETLTVEGNVSQVETQTSAVGTLISSSQMRDLPLNGRNFEQLITLAPGVQQIPANPGVAGEAFYGAQENYAISGSRPEGQAFLLDNTDIADFWNHAAGSNGTGSSLGVESIAEFQVLTNTYGAQFGGNGAVINAVTKSGTNDFHGSAYEFLRNSALDARNYFDLNPDGTPDSKPPFRRNQFGGSLGGPIVKNKLFFFGNYEGYRQSLGRHVGTSVPEPYVSAGELPCNLITPEPEGCTGSELAPVPGAVAASEAIAGLFPTPPLSSPDLGGYANYTSVGSAIANEDYYLGRVDYNLSSSDSVFGRYVMDRASDSEPFAGGPILGWAALATTRNQFLTVEERHIASATVVNLARFTFVRTDERSHTTSAQGENDPLQFYPGRPDGLVTVQGTIVIGGNQALPYYIVQNKFTGGDDLVWTHGAHTLKIGADIVRVQTNLSAPFELGGSYSFPTLQSFLQGIPLTFLGVAPGQTDATRDFREIDYAPYIQDDWKISSRVTLNLGLRYSSSTNAVGVRHPLNNIIDPPFGGFVAVNHVFNSNPNALNFDPRIGFAIDPFRDHKTSIRGGFGIFHDQVAPRTYASGYYFAPPFANAFLAQFIPPFSVPFPNPFPGGGGGGGGGGPITLFAGVDYLIHKAPYQLQYNLQIQHEILRNTVLSIGYVGAAGRDLFTQNDVNAPECNTPGTALGSTPTTDCSAVTSNFAASVTSDPEAAGGSGGTSLPRINPANGSMFTVLGNSTSSYNSLQVAVNRQLTHEIAGNVNYTWSKCLDTGSVTSGLEQFSFPEADPYNPGYDHGRCSFDVRNSVSENLLFVLPFKGNRLVEGWQISEILSASSGMPVNILEGFDNSGLAAAITAARPNYSGAGGCDPNHLENIVSPDPSAPGARQWFDPSCYTVTSFGTLGNVPRDSISGPGVIELDASILKRTKITEKLTAEFRAEFFNLANHTILNAPAAGIFSGLASPCSGSPVVCTGIPNITAGQITSTLLPAREIQFGMKLLF